MQFCRIQKEGKDVGRMMLEPDGVGWLVMNGQGNPYRIIPHEPSTRWPKFELEDTPARRPLAEV